jgi:hypothetical protein
MFKTRDGADANSSVRTATAAMEDAQYFVKSEQCSIKRAISPRAASVKLPARGLGR